VAVDLANGRDQAGSAVASLIDRAALDGALRGDTTAVGAFREALRAASTELGERFRRNEAIEGLVTARAGVVDQIILSAWLHFAAELRDSADLVAVGGYGRGELHPQSDIDLLILLDSTENDGDEAIGRFLTFLWDIGLEVGHSVRTLDDCEAQARGDVTVLTTLMETRLLHGPGRLFAELPVRIGPERMWNSAEFFRAKLDEQNARHARYHDTAYNLEPNVKQPWRSATYR
jgi:[protein-PII] uridylyltransferase